jgi:hypothetical protein
MILSLKPHYCLTDRAADCKLLIRQSFNLRKRFAIGHVHITLFKPVLKNLDSRPAFARLISSTFEFLHFARIRFPTFSLPNLSLGVFGNAV